MIGLPIPVGAEPQAEQVGAGGPPPPPVPRPLGASHTPSPTHTLQIPPGCARYTVKLSKPLGLILEERPEGGIVVVSARCPAFWCPPVCQARAGS